MRPIRSYVLRQGRITSAQSRAYQALLPKYCIPYSENPLDLDQVFGRSAPKFLEIGFGMGETTTRIASENPQNDYFGIEVHTPGVGSLLMRIEELKLCNVRIIQRDAVEVIKHMLPRESLDAVHIFFPDPWPKTRHHKRRLIQATFVALLADRLKPRGILHIATDWENYAKHILAVLKDEPLLANTAKDFAERPEYRPLTKFEQRGLKLGHRVWDLVFRRVMG